MQTSKQRYGIRKGINGVVSVLLGLTLVASVGSSVVSAEEVVSSSNDLELVEINESLVPKELQGRWVSDKGEFNITDTMYSKDGEGFEIVKVDVAESTYTLSYQTMAEVVDVVLTLDKTGEVPTLTVDDVVFTLDTQEAAVVEEGEVVSELVEELAPPVIEAPEITEPETTEPETTATPEETTQAPEVTTQAPVVTTQAPVVTTQAPITTVAPVAQVTTVAPTTTTTVANNGKLAEAGDPVSLVAVGLGLSAVVGGASFLRKKEDA